MHHTISRILHGLWDCLVHSFHSRSCVRAWNKKQNYKSYWLSDKISEEKNLSISVDNGFFINRIQVTSVRLGFRWCQLTIAAWGVTRKVSVALLWIHRLRTGIYISNEGKLRLNCYPRVNNLCQGRLLILSSLCLDVLRLSWGCTWMYFFLHILYLP